MEDTKKINKVDFNKKGNYKVKLIYKHKNKKIIIMNISIK